VATAVFWLLTSYLSGSVPFAFIIGKLKGVDIRRVGSGNVGATNLYRTAGLSAALVAFAGDFLKGYLPASVFPRLWGASDASTAAWMGLACGAAALAGHNWPVFLGFRGGKGVATGAGVLAAVVPWCLGVGAGVWILLVAVTRYVSVASIGAAVAAAATAWVAYRGYGFPFVGVLTILSLLVVWRHRSNIRRLAAGREHRIGRQPMEKAAER